MNSPSCGYGSAARWCRIEQLTDGTEHYTDGRDLAAEPITCVFARGIGNPTLAEADPADLSEITFYLWYHDKAFDQLDATAAEIYHKAKRLAHRVPRRLQEWRNTPD